VQPSHGCRNANSTSTQNKRETPRGRETITTNTASSQQRPSIGNTPRLYSDVAAQRNERKFKLTVTTKRTHTPDEVQNLLKENVKLTDINVGVQSLKTLRDGRVIIEVGSKKEMELLEEGIRERCGEELETNVQKPRKPRLVILNIPNEINMDNAEETLIKQNTEINIQEGNIVPKFIYTTKRGTRNLVVEVDSETRKKLQQIRVKLGWTICRVYDYVSVKRCYRCSRFNHNHRECKGEVCPLCTGNHSLKQCTAAPTEYKCINCMVYKKHHPTTQIDTAHTSLDKKCPSLKAILEKYKKNTEY